MYGPDGQENVPHREWLVAFDKVVNDVKDDLKKQGREDEFVGARVSNIYHQLDMLMISCRIDYLLHSSLHQP